MSGPPYSEWVAGEVAMRSDTPASLGRRLIGDGLFGGLDSKIAEDAHAV
jgi:hypothetical protein